MGLWNERLRILLGQWTVRGLLTTALSDLHPLLLLFDAPPLLQHPVDGVNKPGLVVLEPQVNHILI